MAAVVQNHPDHRRAIVWLDAAASPATTLEGIVSVHAFAEVYAVLTRLPIVPRISPAQAQAIVARFSGFLHVVPEDAAIVTDAIARCATTNTSSGAVFDAIHVVSAEAAQAEVIVTFNEKDFSRLALATTPRVVVPPDPPSLAI